MAAPSAPPLPKYNGGDVMAYLNQLCAALQQTVGQIYAREYQTAAQVAALVGSAVPAAAIGSLYGTSGTTIAGIVGVDPSLVLSSGTLRVTYGTAIDTAAQGNDSRITGALQASTAATTYAPKASPTFTGTVTIPAGAVISGYATTSSLGSYALLASPAFTGTPTAPTAGASTNNTQLATTAYTTTAVATETSRATTAEGLLAPKASPTFTGTVTIPAGAAISGYATLANPTFTGTVTIPAGAAISGYAPLASPALSGTPTAPTAVPATNNTQLATTAYTTTAVATETTRATTAEALLAPKANPTFTGVVTYPTAIPTVTPVNATGTTSYAIPSGGGIFNFSTTGGTFPTFTFNFPTSQAIGISIVITGSITVTAATFSAPGGTVYGAPSSHSPTAAQRYMSDGAGNWFAC